MFFGFIYKEPAVSIVVVVILFFATFIWFLARNRDRFMRGHRAYGEILELVGWEWERPMELILRFEKKFGLDMLHDFQIYDFLNLLERDGKIERRERNDAGSRLAVATNRMRKVVEIRKLPAPSECDRS